MVRGAFLEPGEITTCLISFATQSSTTERATGILEYFIEAQNYNLPAILKGDFELI